MKGTPAALVMLALAASACATSAPQRRAMRHGSAPPPTTWRVAQDKLSRAMKALAPRLEEAGVLADEGSFRGFLSTAGRATHRLQLPPETCATLVAIASAGVHDMDAALYSPQGELLAADAQPDAHPTIQLCTAAQPGDFYYALHVYEGAGSFLMVPFLGSKHSLEAINERLGRPPAVAHFDHGGVDPIDRVTAFSEGVRRRGFERHQSPLRVPLVARQRMRVVLPVRPGFCYTAAGFALEGLGDVNLRVLDDEGSEVARDEGPGDSALQFCADRTAQYAAELHGVSGPGVALLTMFRAESGVLGGPDALWLGERPAARASQTPLPDALEQAAARAVEDGFGRRRTIRTQHLLPGQAVRETVALPARRCTRIHAVGGPGVRALRIAASDPTGARLLSAEGGAHSTYLHVCSTASQAVQVSLHAAAGSGRVALVGFDAPLARSSLAGADALLSARYLQATAQARDAGYRPHPDFERGPRRVAVAAHDSRPLAFETPAARCVRAVLLSPDPSMQAKLLLDGKPAQPLQANATPAHGCGDGERPLGHVDLALQAGEAPGDGWLLLLIK